MAMHQKNLRPRPSRYLCASKKELEVRQTFRTRSTPLVRATCGRSAPDLAKIISSASLAQNVRFHQATERCYAQYRHRRCDTTPSTHNRYAASRARWSIRGEGAG